MQILMTTHGAPHDEVALRFGAEIARRAGELPTVLTVVRNGKDRAKGDMVLTHARDILEEQGLKALTRLRVGHPAAEIIREVEESKHEVVIVGDSRNHNLVTRFLHGSTAVRVVEHAPCPVVVAKGRVGPVRRILLCDSGAESPSASLRASPSAGLPAAAHPSGSPPPSASLPSRSLPSRSLGTGGTGRIGGTRDSVGVGPSLLGRFTAQMAGLLEGMEEVTVLHVMSQMSAGPGVEGESLRAGVEELIARATPEGELLGHDIEALQQLGIQAHAEVRHGLVVDEILSESQKGDYDLVVIGAYRGEGWKRILLDDLAHRILVQLDRPVLVVR